MQEFTAYYWFAIGEKGRSICETIQADSLEQATDIVQERLKRPSFAVHSPTDGHVLVHSANVLFVEMEPSHHQ